ncbi:MAG: hypothetical protein WC285_02490 [Candidatus Gracilibacteria bacterium]|jgi:hypothetical protein
MFKENRFIFEHAESSPSGRRVEKLSFGEAKEYNGVELPKEIQEKEKKEKEDNVRVAEHLLNNLENFGIKCPRCGLKNVSEIGTIPPNKRILYCLDCKWKWEV